MSRSSRAVGRRGARFALILALAGLLVAPQTVLADTITVTASSGSMTYGDSPPTITPGYSGAGPDTTPATCSTTATSSSPVGSYPSSCGGAVDSVNDFTYVDGSVSVSPAPLTITASGGTMEYGSTPPDITPGYSAGAPSTPPTCSTAATGSSGVGSYASSCSGASDGNYTISYADGSVSVTPATLTVTASSGSMVYGGTPPVITPSYGGLRNGATAPGSLPTCTANATSATPAGTYPSTCLGAADPNYTVTPVSGTVLVTRAPVTITASSSTMLFGSPPPVITPIYSGLRNSAVGAAFPPTCTTAATSSSPAGTIWPATCTGASDPNYSFAYVAGAVTVLGGNTAPACADSSGATSLNATGTGKLTCSDPDGNVLHYRLVKGAAHGTASVNDAGTWTYTPAADFLGTDSFTFRANDGALDSNVATFTISVQPDPTAHNDVATVRQGSGPTRIAVLVNDVDNDPGDFLIVSAVTQGANGKVAVLPDGSGLTYDPNGAFVGTDSFTYTVVDTTHRTSTAFVQVKVVPVQPVTSVPTVIIVARAPGSDTTVRVRVAWALVDAGSGLAGYEVQQRIGTGAWTSVGLTSPKAHSVLQTIRFGKAVTFRVRGIDTARHVGPWATSRSITSALNQETVSTIFYSGTWRTGSGSGLSGGHSRYSGQVGASATFSFTGWSFGWISQLGPRQGRASISVDGVVVSTVSLRSTTSATKQVVWSRRWATRGLHTIRIVVLSSPGGSRVDFDAATILR